MSKREMTRRHKLGLAVLALATTVAAGTVFAQQRAISIATGGTGGVYYPLGGGTRQRPVEDDPRDPGDGGSHRRLSGQS